MSQNRIMETLHSEYLSYFQRQPNGARQLVKGTKRKVLPRVGTSESFQVRLRNQQLLKGIINPKRDTIILESLKEATRRKLHVSLHSKRKQLSLENASRPKSEHHGKFSPNCGFIKRKVQYRLLIDDGGVLTSIEQVQNDTSCRMQTQINEYLFPRSCGHGNVETYGHGPTLLMITKLAVKCCPVIKSDTLVLLQLILKTGTIEQNIGSGREEAERGLWSQKTLMTKPIFYEDLSGQGKKNFGVKFALRLGQIGDFVPLRVWKCQGTQSQVLGIIDLDLAAYRNKRLRIRENRDRLIRNEEKDELIRREQRDKLRRREGNDLANLSVQTRDTVCRQVFKSCVVNCMRNKKGLSSSTAEVNYLIYAKKYDKQF